MPKRSVVWVVLVAVTCVVVVPSFFALVLRTFVIEAFRIPTSTMIPTLLPGDHIFVSKHEYGPAKTPKRGDVIVHEYPRDRSKDYVKRVIAVAGDTIRIEGAEVLINGKALERSAAEPYRYQDVLEDPDSPQINRDVLAYTETAHGDPTRQYRVIYGPMAPHRLGLRPGPGLTCTEESCTIDAGQLFVLGDNRDNSSDSRVWGCVPTEWVKGRATMVWWPRARYGTGVR